MDEGRRIVRNTCVAVGAIQVGELDAVLSSIRPVKTSVDVVIGESIGPSYVCVYDHATV